MRSDDGVGAAGGGQSTQPGLMHRAAKAAPGTIRASSRAILVGVMLTLAPLHAAEADPDSARRLAREAFQQGLALLDAKRYRLALDAFERAYSLSPHYRVLYNIGWAHVALEQPRLAVAAFERYLAQGGADISPERRAAVARIIERERGKLGELALDTHGDRAAVRVDGLPMGDTPLAAPLLLSPGTHRLAVSASGQRTMELDVEVRPGEITALDLELRGSLTQLIPMQQPGAVAADDPDPASSRRALGYVLAGTGIGLAGFGLAHFLWNEERFDDWRKTDDALRQARTDLDYYRRQVDNNRLAASIEDASRVTVTAAIGAGVLLGLGLVLVSTAPRPAGVAAELSAGPAGIRVQGTW